MKLNRKFYKDMANDEYLRIKWERACEDLKKRKRVRCVVQKENGSFYHLQTLKILSDTDGMTIIVRKK